jgi:riboflavin synthase
VSSAGSSGLHIGIDLGALARDTKPGDSIAVNGACLTVARLAGPTTFFAVSQETLSVSTLPSLRPGAMVNIERALRVGDRMGGHLVQGHVDGTAVVKKTQRISNFLEIEFTVANDLLKQMVIKGSVAVDGISLTIATLHPDGFSVAVIPETLSRTTLGKIKAGQQVNIEVDMIIKAIRRYLDGLLPETSTFSVEKLRQMGF